MLSSQAHPNDFTSSYREGEHVSRGNNTAAVVVRRTPPSLALQHGNSAVPQKTLFSTIRWARVQLLHEFSFPNLLKESEWQQHRTPYLQTSTRRGHNK